MRAAKYFDKERLKGLTFTEGNKVFLVRKNFKTKGRPSNKLDYVKIGPLEVIKVIRLDGINDPVNYRLKLPKGIRIYLVFYILLLKPALPNAKLMNDSIEVEEDD